MFLSVLKFIEDSWRIALIPDLTKLAVLGIGHWLENRGNWVALSAYLGLAALLFFDSWREKPN